MAMVFDPATGQYVNRPDQPGGGGAGTGGISRPTEAGLPGSFGAPPIGNYSPTPVSPLTGQPGYGPYFTPSYSVPPSYSQQQGRATPGGGFITNPTPASASFSAPGISGVYPNAAVSGLAGASGVDQAGYPGVGANQQQQSNYRLGLESQAQQQDMRNRLDALRQLSGTSGLGFGFGGPLPPFQGAPLPGVAPVNVSAAQDAAFARAKDRIGQNLRASVDTYGDIAAAGGQNVVGGTNPQYQKQVMDLVGQAGGGLGDVIRDQAMEQARAGLEAAFANQQAGLAQRGQDVGIRGQDITLRGQDIASKNALYGLMFGPSSLGRLSY